jgi:hypothetical protein
LIVATDEYKKVEETAKGMGQAVSYFKATTAILERAKSVVLLIPPNY